MRLRKLVHISAAAAMSMGVVGVTALNVSPVHAASITAPGCSATVGNSSTATMSRVGANCILSFTSGSNSFTVPAGMTSVRALVVGGGGAGGHNGGGGGGGGEVRYNATYSVTASATINLTVAAGGAAPSPSDWDAAGGSGDSSTFGTITASGGGGGGSRGAHMNGLPGYTGGGGGGYPTVGGTGTSGANGGNGADLGCDSTGGGGGGASGASGTNGSNRLGGSGGNGVSYDISGTATYYGGGGAGGGTCDNSRSPQDWSGTPGLGGGAGASTAATPNTGGGGGGGGAVGWSCYGGAGGSGVVILSWPGDALTSMSATLSSTTSTTDGFTFNITNIGSLSAYTIAATSTSGTVTRSSGAVTVSGLAAGASATVTVTTSRSGYTNATSTVSGSAIPAPTTTTSSTSTTVAVAAPATTAAPIGQAAVATIAPTSSTSSTSTSVPETTTTTTVAARTRNAALPAAPVAPEAPSADPGQASLLVDGQTVDGTITRSNDQLVITAGEMKATISGLTADGAIAPLDTNGNIHLSEGDSLAMSAEGFNPGSEVEVWLFSTPTRLGTAKVSVDGKIDASFKVPSGLPKGQHRLVLSGLNTKKADSVFAVGIVFGKSSGVGTVGKVLIVTPLALAIIAALVLPARRRRKGAIA